MNNLKLKISKLLVKNKYKIDTGNNNTAVYVVDIPKVSDIISKDLDFEKHFENWCKETKKEYYLERVHFNEFFLYLNNNILKEMDDV